MDGMTEQLYKEGMEQFKEIIDNKDRKINELKNIIRNSDLACRDIQHKMSELKGMVSIVMMMINHIEMIKDHIMGVRNELDVSDDEDLDDLSEQLLSDLEVSVG
jgi:hypothetical protein